MCRSSILNCCAVIRVAQPENFWAASLLLIPLGSPETTGSHHIGDTGLVAKCIFSVYPRARIGEWAGLPAKPNQDPDAV